MLNPELNPTGGLAERLMMNSKIVNIPGYTITARERKSKYIHEFTKTPAEIICPHFWVLSQGNLCPFACSYCYLEGTFRWGNAKSEAPVVFVDDPDSEQPTQRGMKREVEGWLNKPGNLVLNAGELSDALVFDHWTKMSRWLIPLFGEQRNHKLLLLTKSDNVKGLLELPHNGQTIVSFSINALEVSKRFEAGAPLPTDRLSVAKLCQDAGYPVRLRIDPMIPVEGWKEKYTELMRLIGDLEIKPERITVGSLRYFPTVRTAVKSSDRPGKDVFDYGREWTKVDGRLRVDFNTRIEMYRLVLGYIKFYLDKIGFGICKETEKAWEEIGEGIPRGVCNCTT